MKINKIKICLFIIFFTISIILFLISLKLNQYGIIIGWMIGLIISLLLQFLSLKLKQIKNVDSIKIIVFFIIFRFFVIIVGLLFCFLMQFYFKNELFYYSSLIYSFELSINNLVIFLYYKIKKNE